MGDLSSLFTIWFFIGFILFLCFLKLVSCIFKKMQDIDILRLHLIALVFAGALAISDMKENGPSWVAVFALIVTLFDTAILYKDIKNKDKNINNDNNTDESDRKILEQISKFGNEKFEKGKKIGYELGEKDGIEKGKQQAYAMINTKLENKDKNKINKCETDKCEEHINNPKD